MNKDLNELYLEIVDYNKKDFDTLLNYYIELLKDNNILLWNDELVDIKEHFKDKKELNIRNLWFYLESKYNEDNIGKPLVFSFNNELKMIENKLTEKAREIENKYIEYYNSSAYFIALKEKIINLLNDNTTGLSFNMIVDNIDLNNDSKEHDVERAINSLIQDDKIAVLENRNPMIYYLK